MVLSGLMIPWHYLKLGGFKTETIEQNKQIKSPWLNGSLAPWSISVLPSMAVLLTRVVCRAVSIPLKVLMVSNDCHVDTCSSHLAASWQHLIMLTLKHSLLLASMEPSSPASLDHSSLSLLFFLDLLFLLNRWKLEDPRVLVLSFTNYILFLSGSFYFYWL